METLAEFVERLRREVNCFYHQCNSGIFSIKRNNTNIRGMMGVFGWVRELKRRNIFEISTYQKLCERAHVNYHYDQVKPGMHYVSRINDAGQGTGIVFYAQRDSKGMDYNKAVEALRAILMLN